MRWFAFTVMFALPLAARAQDLNPAKAAQIEHDQQVEYDRIDQQHGNKLPSEMSADERREIIHERAKAEQKVFDKQGVSPKDYTIYIAKLGLDDRAAMKEAAEKLRQQDEEDKRTADALKTMRAGAGITIEHGLPPDAEAEQAAASNSNGAAEPTPQKNGKRTGH